MSCGGSNSNCPAVRLINRLIDPSFRQNSNRNTAAANDRAFDSARLSLEPIHARVAANDEINRPP